MPYLKSMLGDYGPRTYRGDPGLFGSLWKGIKGAATGFVTGGPIGAIGGAIKGVATKPTTTRYVQPSATTRPTTYYKAPAAPTAPAPGTVARTPLGMPYVVKGKRRKRMNVANPRALRRAIRRQSGFVKLARRALKGTGYTIVSRGARRRGVSISETGPGSVTVRR